MSVQDEDSPFEAALKGDLPSGAEQARVRQRLLGAGISVGSGLAASSAVASTPLGWGASLVAKVGALSLAAKVGLVVAVAAPLVAVPLVRSSAVHRALASGAPVPVAQATAAVSSSALTPLGAPSEPLVPVAPSVAPRVEAPNALVASTKPTAGEVAASGPPSSERLAAPSARADPSAALPSVAAFDSVASGVGKAESERLRATTLAAETQLLDRAFAEIAAGHRDAAAALIAEHQRRFPNGLLSQERERARARLEQGSQGE